MNEDRTFYNLGQPFSFYVKLLVVKSLLVENIPTSQGCSIGLNGEGL